MVQFVVFLRGINVGGHIVVKQKLREIFASLGFQNVSTYKQSGNVIFDAEITDPDAVKAEIESKLREVLGYDVATFVCAFPQLKQIVDSEPFKGCEKEGVSFLVTFLAKSPVQLPFQIPFTIPKSGAKIISSDGNLFFSVTHGGGEGGLPNPFLESKLGVKATTRDLNIIREIVEKYGM